MKLAKMARHATLITSTWKIKDLAMQLSSIYTLNMKIQPSYGNKTPEWGQPLPL